MSGEIVRIHLEFTALEKGRGRKSITEWLCLLGTVLGTLSTASLHPHGVEITVAIF